ncbi:MAG: tetratricopeptide repeat protein, partial [Xanthomonadales bacterium]
MARKIRLRVFPCLLASLALALSACAGYRTVPVADREVETRVRAPASQKSKGVQVFPLQNPAVRELLADAGNAETTGDFAQAVVLLERALRIQPRDPEILQQMAEVQLQKQDYKQALNFAVRSYDIGSRVGEICDRNWRTISVAREHLGDRDGSVQAE